jgi:hypothetical protein
LQSENSFAIRSEVLIKEIALNNFPSIHYWQR